MSRKQHLGERKREESVKTDYGNYRLSLREIVQFLLEAAGICAVTNYLFYKSWAVFVFMLPLIFFYVKMRKKKRELKRRKELYYQFKDALNALRVGIAAGYSLENAVGEAQKDLVRIYGENACISREFSYIKNQINFRIPIEELFYDLGIRSRNGEILNFSEILVQSRRMGGNMKEILQNCIRTMEEHMDAEKEIDAVLGARKMEQKIMSLIPLGIILYLQAASPEFIGILYGNLMGAGVMTLCLGAYLTACIWGERLVDIEV